MDYRSRCSVMEACLPISEFKHQTVKLHVDMLNEIESLRAKLAEAENREMAAKCTHCGYVLFEVDNSLIKDAELYRKLRASHWGDGAEALCVVRSKDIRPGVHTYRIDALDAAIDNQKESKK